MRLYRPAFAVALIFLATPSDADPFSGGRLLQHVHSSRPVIPVSDEVKPPDSDTDIFALMLRNVFGAKLKLVSGYPGTNDVTLAMERGEINGLCGLSWSTVKTRHMDWIKATLVYIPVQMGLQKEAAIADVPGVLDLVKGDEQTRMVRLILAGQAVARPYAAPPGIPDDRRRALIAAFDRTMKDPEFLADAEKLQADVNPMTAGEIDRLLAEIYATPKDIVAKAAKAIAN